MAGRHQDSCWNRQYLEARASSRIRICRRTIALITFNRPERRYADRSSRTEFRRAEVQRNFDSSEEWEHKIEQSTGLPEIHSATNLSWTDSDFNSWLNAEFGRPRQKEIVEGDRTRLVSWREYLSIHGNDQTRREFKERLYTIRRYREVPHNGPRGYWQALTR